MSELLCPCVTYSGGQCGCEDELPPAIMVLTVRIEVIAI